MSKPHEYTLDDFSETVNALPWQPAKVLAAFGKDGYLSEWEGGFAVESEDGRVAVVVGWCDTTGWGCQDGTTLLCDLSPTESNERGWQHYVNAWARDGSEWDHRPTAEEWETDPTDLNIWVQEGMVDTNEWGTSGSTEVPAWRAVEDP